MDEPSCGSEPDWAQIRIAFEAGLTSQRKIARRYAVSESAIRYRARTQGWDRTHRPVRERATGTEEADDAAEAVELPGAGASRRRKKPPDRVEMIARLYRIFEARIAALEARFDPDGGAEAERDTKLLAALARTLDTLIALDRKAGNDAASAAEERSDLDDIRQDLARRLDRLARSAGGG
ncbi:hypothetical protein [Amorphus sp. 3PC139-8]|uniref:hypothetical protein n=1 Tax=Amorphus sp. 3PC139-8 TaxID=2735676 RepID=UPI00345CCD07